MPFLVFGLFILYGFDWDTVGRRLQINVVGTIVQKRDVPSTGAPRYITEYVVRNDDGHEQVFSAGPTDGSLPRSMPVGTRIHKEPWHLDFVRNGNVEQFPFIFYGVTLGIALSSIVWRIYVVWLRW